MIGCCLILLIGNSYAQEIIPKVSLEFEQGEVLPLERDGIDGVWISKQGMDRINDWRIELSGARQKEEIEKEKSQLHKEYLRLDQKEDELYAQRLEIEKEKVKLSEREEKLQRKRARRAEIRSAFAQIALVGVLFL